MEEQLPPLQSLDIDGFCNEMVAELLQLQHPMAEPTITTNPQCTGLLSDIVNFKSSAAANLPDRPEPEPRRPKLRVGRWNKEERMSFLMGVKKYGKGNWKDIATKLVLTRTPSQVASHAQKYFKYHQNPPNWNTSSSSSCIFDITTVDPHSKRPSTVQPPSPPLLLPLQQFTITNYYPPSHQPN